MQLCPETKKREGVSPGRCLMVKMFLTKTKAINMMRASGLMKVSTIKLDGRIKRTPPPI